MKQVYIEGMSDGELDRELEEAEHRKLQAEHELRQADLDIRELEYEIEERSRGGKSRLPGKESL